MVVGIVDRLVVNWYEVHSAWDLEWLLMDWWSWSLLDHVSDVRFVFVSEVEVHKFVCLINYLYFELSDQDMLCETCSQGPARAWDRETRDCEPGESRRETRDCEPGAVEGMRYVRQEPIMAWDYDIWLESMKAWDRETWEQDSVSDYWQSE